MLVGLGPATVRFDLCIVENPVGRFLCDGKGAGYCTFGIVKTDVIAADVSGSGECAALLGNLTLEFANIGVDLIAVVTLRAHGEAPEWELAFCHGAVLRHASICTAARIVVVDLVEYRFWLCSSIGEARGSAEQAAVAHQAMVIGAELHVCRSDQEHPIADPLHLAPKAVTEAATEVDEPST